MNTYTVTTIVTGQQIADQIVAAFNGGSNYWIRSVDLGIHRDYGLGSVYEGDFEFTIVTNDGGRFLLNPANIRTGLDKIDSGTLSDILQNEGDADTADMFLQHCLFGEPVYG